MAEIRALLSPAEIEHRSRRIERLCEERARQYFEIIAKKDDEIACRVQEMRALLTPEQWQAWLQRMDWGTSEARQLLTRRC